MDIFNLVIQQSKNPESENFWHSLRQRVATKFPFAFGNSNSDITNIIINTNANNNNNSTNNTTSYQPYNPYQGYSSEVNSTPNALSQGQYPQEDEDIDTTEWCKQIDLRYLTLNL